MTIRQLRETDQSEWIRLKTAMWPDADPEELEEELPAYLESGDARLYALVAERDSEGLAALIELSLRTQAEGCLSSPVAYVESWYVDEDVRRQGLARELLAAAADWARHRGCAEIASSCVVDNDTAAEVHEKLGFEEVDRLIHFVYELAAEG
ncbi:MAG: GNAT family N-acetyltransferase [Armatimonadetes bacterium]|nr:GNAT family N-acetyltransferase [Armatimonadota bacterium]